MKHIKTLTIIDDDEIFVFLTKIAVERTHAVEKIKIFKNGKEAIDYFLKNYDNTELLPEMILLDLSMPIMDGWQFLEEFIKLKPKIGKKIVIYIVTSSISPEDIKKAKGISAVSDFIIKPISKEKLIEVILKL